MLLENTASSGAGDCRAGSAASARSRASPAPRSPASAVASSCAARSTIRQPSAPRRPRRCRRRWSGAASEACGGSVMTAATQAIAPSSSPGRFGLRPWNTREAFQTMPQATKPTRIQRQRKHLAKRVAGEGPERDRCGAEQIGACPTISAPGCSPACRRTAAWLPALPQPWWQRDRA